VNAVDGLNLRAQSNATASVIAVVRLGQHLTALGARVGPDDKGIVWQQVRTDAGQTGWVAADFLTSTKPVATAAATAAATVTAAPTSAAATELFNRINALRAQKGLPAYALNSQLTAAALAHSQDIANTGNITHTGSDGSTSAQRIKAAGYSGAFTSENIYGGQVSVDDVWGFWSTDKDHLPNLIDTRFTDIGIGVVTSGSNTYYTADFGGP
jgi:uncharacterized protein YkwD